MTETVVKTNTSIVYIVDDDAGIREALSELLISVGIRVAACASASDYLRMAKPDVPACLIGPATELFLIRMNSANLTTAPKGPAKVGLAQLSATLPPRRFAAAQHVVAVMLQFCVVPCAPTGRLHSPKHGQSEFPMVAFTKRPASALLAL